jgi:hypothetical protein
MKGILQKHNTWIVLYNEEKIPLHPIDGEQLEIDTRSDILIDKSIEFERLGLYAKYSTNINLKS